MTTLLAPAKINLFLDILRRREDGFHDLHTVFMAVDLCDVIRVVAQGGGAPFVEQLEVVGPYSGGITPGADNLIARAVDAFAARFGERSKVGGLSIRLEKNIPHGAGLGGGSSDAAAMLRFLGTQEGIGSDELAEVAGAVGSDCPFFLGPPVAEGAGRGEVLTPLPVRDCCILIARPGFGIGTREAYGALRPEMLGPRSDVAGLRRWLSGETDVMPDLRNSFETALDPVHPELVRIRERMYRHGAMLARLSGSGSASFGIFPDEASRTAARRELELSAACFECRPVKG